MIKAKAKKIILIVFVSVLAAILSLGAGFGIFVGVRYGEIKKFKREGNPFPSQYTLDERGYFISNIPRETYLTEGDSYEYDGKTIFDIRSFGAFESAAPEVNASAVNEAITEASACGGVVLVTGGRYTARNIIMRSDVTLKITSDAELRNVGYEDSVPSDENAFIYMGNCENVTVSGPGKISGQGATYCNEQEDSSLFYPLDTFNLKAYVTEHRKRIMTGKTKEVARPYLIYIKNCSGVTVKNVELYEASSWTMRMEDNEDLKIENVVINNNVRVANSDGIDIVGGKNIAIRNCFISTGDDGICLKTEKESGAIENVIVENCEVFSLANCFKIGTDTYKDVRNISVRNCYFFMPGIAGGYAGVAIEAVDGGKVSEVNVEDIIMYHVTSPLLLWLGYRHSESTLSNVNIKNVVAIGCDLPSAVVGYEKGGKAHNVTDVTLTGFKVSYREAKAELNIYKKDKAYSGSMNMGGYPEITRVSHRYFINHDLSAYYDLPVYGLYAANVENLKVIDFSVTPRNTEKRALTNYLG